MELEFLGFVIKTSLNFKSQGTQKIKLFSQGTYDSPNLRYETLICADYDHVKVSCHALLDMK